jgi:YCII-related domain
MRYALLTYAPAEAADRATRPLPHDLAARFDRPDITGWLRLHADESATTLRHGAAADEAAGGEAAGGEAAGNEVSRMSLTDGAFIDSKEYLAGLILIEAENLDRALATAAEMLRPTRRGTAIEVRPILDGHFRAA